MINNLRITLVLVLAFICVKSSSAQCDDLFFSEYIEGSSSNKALEIYNPTANDINLSNYVIYRANNGSLTPTDSITPQGMILAGDVFVIGNPSANADIQAQTDTTHTLTFYNGDDAIYMINITTGDTLDIIGVIGVDPGSGWTVGSGATNNTTLVRMSSITEGTTDWTIGATQWDVFPIDVTDSLGMHTSNCGAAPSSNCTDLFFSEYIEGSSSNKALEIYNPTMNDIDLSNYVVYRANNGSLTPTDSIAPQGMILAGDVFVIGNPSANADIQAQTDTTHTLTFYNGDDAIYMINTTSGDTLDIIGVIGVDPGSGWTVGSGATNNTTLVRKPTILSGTTDWSNASMEWDVFPIDATDSLGMHSINSCNPSVILDPMVSFSSGFQTVNETDASATVTVTIANENAFATTVDVILSMSSTATNGADFMFMDTTITFAAMSNVSQDLAITLTDDMLTEGDETIVLEFTNPTNNASTGGVHTITIIDDEVPVYNIGLVSSVDTAGVADSVGVRCGVRGLVYGVNLRPSGLQFTIIDNTGGLGVFNGSGNFGYTLAEGDSIEIQGTISQFNGLTQINPDTVIYFTSGNTLQAPTEVTSLGESTESELIKINGVSLIDPSQWTGSGSGFNVDISNGVDTFAMRIDADVDLYSMPVPTGSFDICGLGGQFDSSVPHLSGYQLIPRYQQDVKIIVDLGPDTAVCNNFILDSEWLNATNLWNTSETTSSITVDSSGTYSVDVTYGTETVSDTITVTVNSVIAAPVSSDSTACIDEDLVMFTANATGATTYAWDFGDGNSSLMENPSHTYTATGMYTITLTVGDGTCTTDYTLDIETFLCSGTSPLGDSEINVYPTIVNDYFAIEGTLNTIQDLTMTLVNVSGQTVWTYSNGSTQFFNEKVDVTNLASGIYFLHIVGPDSKKAVKLIKQ